jgi:predicted HNH restriction endonuclease
MITKNIDLIKGINRYLENYHQNTFSAHGITINLNQKKGNYWECKIGRTKYLIAFIDKWVKGPDKCFIHLYDNNRVKPSVVQFTIDGSNFHVDKTRFQLIQNRGTTIGQRIVGFEAEFKNLMISNGFNSRNIIIEADKKKPNYEDILSQLFLWLKIRVKTKLQLEEKYRKIEDRTHEDESNLNIDNTLDIESRTEGGKKLIISARNERDEKNREDAIRIHGLVCKGCGFDFEKTYGNWGKGFIEVHHAVPLSKGGERLVNPATDLTIVCSNCHRMIHRKKNITLTLDELRSKIKKIKK